MKKILFENLLPGDLAHLVDTTVSIDEFEGKIDPDAKVVAFLVAEEDPAHDLGRFIEFGPIDQVLDTEVSPAPDKHGNYVLFVEIETRNKTEFIDVLAELLEIVSFLTGNETWKFKYRGKVYNFKPDFLAKVFKQ